jgi:hypothetical protein
VTFTAFGSTTPSALRGSGTQALVGAGTIGDTNNRVELDADGAIRWGSGGGATDVTLNRSSPGILTLGGAAILQTPFLSITSGFCDVTTVGKGYSTAEGTNAKQGTAVLVAGSVVVANTSVTASSRIFLTSQADGGAPGFLRVSARVVGTSFTITSSSPTDTSTVAYEIFEPG